MILTTKELTKKYSNETVVNKLSFSLHPGKCIALIGPNGAGKTTTLRMLAGLIQPTSGTIMLSDTKKDFRQLIGYLPQHPVFFEWMSGEEYLIYVAKLSFMNKTTAKKQAHRLLERTGILEAKDKRIATYSGGMKQRLGIAQAMIHQPKILMLDEPVSALDPAGRREILTLIENLKDSMTILFSTHILADADEVCDELLLMREGLLIESGSMSLLREKYKSSKIEMTFSEGEDNMNDLLLDLSTVTNIAKVRQTYHVTVTDIAKARKEILQTATEQNWALHSFFINQASLEDMFMKAVKK